MHFRRTAVVVTAAVAMTLAGGGAAGAEPSQPHFTKYAVKTLYTPAKGHSADVGNWWKKDGHGGYNGHFTWAGADDHVSVQTKVYRESGRVTHKKMKFGKDYPCRGARSVYMRACDNVSCSRWW